MDRRSILVGLLGLGGATASVRCLQAMHASDSEVDLAGAKAPPPIREAGTSGIKAVTLAQVPLGGGGFVTGIDISADGQRFVCRTDVANAYVRNSSDAAWRPLFSPTTMQLTDYDPLPALNGKADGQGVAGVRIAPSNKDVIVASYHGYVWKSVDGGRSMRRTRLPQKAMPSNGGVQRLYNRTIDIHPRDPQRIVVGTHGEGVWFTLDGGELWDRAKLPEAGTSNDGTRGINLVLFDPAMPERVYALVTGSGLYRSDNGPAGQFQLVSNGPTICSSLVAGPDGTIYLCEQTKSQSGKVWRYRPDGGWTSAAGTHEAIVLAVNPAQPNRLIASDPNDYFIESEDSGRTWRSIGGAAWKRSSGEVAWSRGLTTMFPAEIRFDPVDRDRLWIAQGVGVANTLATGAKYQLEDWSAGIEELCTVAAISPPGGTTVVSALDKPFWRIQNMASYSNDFRYPRVGGNVHDPSLVVPSSYLDYAGDDPSFLVGVVGTSDKSAPGFSTDGGQMWQAFPATPATGWGYGGCIAASTKKNFVLLPSNNGVGAFTLDGGRKWSPIKLDNVNATGGFSNAYYVARKNLAADKSRPGTFALVYTVIKNDAYEEPFGGVWVTRNGGQGWTQVLTGVVSAGSHEPSAALAQGLDARQFWQCQLDYIPGRSGELVYTPHADFAADRFYWSADDGKNWRELHPKIRNVSCFGFGKAAPGQARPAIYFWGEVDGATGLYASLDWFATAPRLVTRFPSKMLAKVSFVTGDPDTLGRLHVGTSCAGVIRVDVEY